jgi:hypothetical protein
MAGAGRDVFLRHPVQMRYKAHIAFYLIGTRDFFLCGKISEV